MEGPGQDLPFLWIYRLYPEQCSIVCLGRHVWNIKVYRAADSTSCKRTYQFSVK